MYRDLISAPEQIEAAGRKWWLQQFNKWDGSFEAVNLYDEDGDFVAEFESMEELQDFLSKIQPNGCCWEV